MDKIPAKNKQIQIYNSSPYYLYSILCPTFTDFVTVHIYDLGSPLSVQREHSARYLFLCSIKERIGK